MGSRFRGQIKKIQIEEPYEELLENFEAEVKAALGGDGHDAVLNSIISLTLASIDEERPLFTSILDEPVLWKRHFVRWIKEYLEEEDVVRRATEDAFAALSSITGAI